jgi:hypothetical protein
VEELKTALAELNPVSIIDRDVRELGTGSGAQIDPGSRAPRQFAMSRHEVGMEVSLYHVFDFPISPGRRLEIDINVALSIDDGCDASEAIK